MPSRKQRLTPATVVSLAQQMVNHPRVPCATYRLQFNAGFTFNDAVKIVPYLSQLGISDCYASPLLKACSGSRHGYDITDHSQLNPEIGTEAEFDRLSSALQRHDMGLILDTVPNHMSIRQPSNVWWMDVLENGPSSIYASYFDIDWHPVKPELENKVLLPILEEQYGSVLESGKLRLAYEEGAFYIYYYDHKLPVAPQTYTDILRHDIERLSSTLGEEDGHLQELQSILTAINYLPPSDDVSPDKVMERNREKEVIKRRIAALYEASREVRAAVDAALKAFNGDPTDPQSFDLLDRLMAGQSYRLAFWRVASDEINYRRFFDVNDLAAIRVELPEVFQATHPVVFQLLAEGKAHGLRIDHPDGLWNPSHYFHQLQETHLTARLAVQLPPEATGLHTKEIITDWFSQQTMRQKGSSGPALPLYVVVEKILAHGESLRPDWEVHGTTGYDFLNAVNGIFVDQKNHKTFDKIYESFIGYRIDYHNLVNSCKKMIMLISMSSEITVISYQLDRITERNRRYRDFTLNSLTFALREVIAGLPVYRTYITGPDTVSPQDRTYIEAAVREAKRRNPRTAPALFDFIRDTLLLEIIDDFREQDRGRLIEFVMKFQQLTGPVMAKAVEDTAFYVYNRLVALNEVGGHPEHFGTSVAAFHRENLRRHQHWPHSLLATTTHDTKRSEDVRARIAVLSEIPREWRTVMSRWSRLNVSKKTMVNGEPAPSRNDEYLLYQTLLGAWPPGPLQGEAEPDNRSRRRSSRPAHLSAEEFAQFRDRIAGYMEKATREAKVHTSWINPNEDYDRAVRDFVLRILDDRGRNLFLRDLAEFQRRIAFYGYINSLAQVLLKLTAPGVPDIYQGNEVWDFSLVDPDNRRPANYERHRRLLHDLMERIAATERPPGAPLTALTDELLDTVHDGRIKLYLTHRTLHYRRAHRDLFLHGGYQPLEAVGVKGEHVCAFLRRWNDLEIVVIVPRLLVGLTGGDAHPPHGPEVWEDTVLPLPSSRAGDPYRHLFTNETVQVVALDGVPALRLADVLSRFPAAVLEHRFRPQARRRKALAAHPQV